MLSEALTFGGDDPALHPEVLEALRAVHDPCSVATGVPIDIVDMGLVASITRDHGTVEVGLCLTSPACWQAIGMAAAIESAVLRLGDVTEVRCALDMSQHWMPDRMDARARARLREVRSPAVLRRQGARVVH
jgi:metal-sulfur cluster biosynthetic enzyme